jgi:hypothetical protein
MKTFKFTYGEILRQNESPAEAKDYILTLLLTAGFDFARPVYCVKSELDGDIEERYYQFDTQEICNPSSLESENVRVESFKLK